jgi:hypothetical protein
MRDEDEIEGYAMNLLSFKKIILSISMFFIIPGAGKYR